MDMDQKTHPSPDLKAALTDAARKVEQALAARLILPDQSGILPARLFDAMRHGALNGGKRLRPFLVLESAKLFGLEGPAVLNIATALEAIHCYSLIHDDLPAMDDDDLRRGQPTVHKAFDEASAILAGDGLLTLAFEILAEDAPGISDHARLTLITDLAKAAGPMGMVGGQALDLEAETIPPDNDADIIMTQAMKTGALIRFAACSGALAASAPKAELDALTLYGDIIGLAFQIADDLLDITQSSATLGKTAGKDIAAGKATLVARNGQPWAEAKLLALKQEADDALAPFGDRAIILKDLAQFIIARKS